MQKRKSIKGLKPWMKVFVVPSNSYFQWIILWIKSFVEVLCDLGIHVPQPCYIDRVCIFHFILQSIFFQHVCTYVHAIICFNLKEFVSSVFFFIWFWLKAFVLLTDENQI